MNDDEKPAITETPAPEEAASEKPAPKKAAPKKPVFDADAPYAEVRGQGIKARYFQDGQYFGATGDPLGKKMV